MGKQTVKLKSHDQERLPFSARHFAPFCARDDSRVKDMRSIAATCPW